MIRRLLFAIAVLLLASPVLAADGELRFAEIGDLPLESGETLKDVRVGYRAWGTLAADQSNVLVVSTWFGGTSEALGGWIGEGNLFDTRHYHVIAFDALANGVSTSPSNSATQGGAAFPKITMWDMARSQHAALTRVLGFDRVHAVSGVSMGGMQTFAWMFLYPDYMKKAVPIVGTPKQTAHDMLFWGTQLDLIESARGNPAATAAAMRAVARMNQLELRTPEWVVTTNRKADLVAWVKEQGDLLAKRDPESYAAQLRAMMDLDVFARFGGSIEETAKAIRPKVMIVVALQDQTVRPEPSRELARAAKAEVVTLSGTCGHLATSCERDVLIREVHRFLND
ncbi:MAG TPA: alpha/beta fold hydrolase [Thermoanaerobaculia bacterium]